MPILTEETIEGACLIKNGQVLIAVFRPIPIGELRIPYPRSSRANPIGDAIGGQRIVVPAYVPPFRASPDKSALPINAKPAVAFSTLGNKALINAKITSLSPFSPGGLSREIEGLPRLQVRLFNIGKSPSKIRTKAIGAKLNGLGDEEGLPSTPSAFNNSFRILTW